MPYRPRPIAYVYFRGSGWYTWLLQDQRFADHRPDVLSWETGPLADDVESRAPIAAHLFASTTGSDADWVVKLIDVYPEEYPPNPRLGGYQLMVANDVFRGRYRRSFEHPKAIVPNRVRSMSIDLHTNDYRFLKGHRIMVQVQSTWFPIIDRNPQTFVPNIFKATRATTGPPPSGCIARRAIRRTWSSRSGPGRTRGPPPDRGGEATVIRPARGCAPPWAFGPAEGSGPGPDRARARRASARA